MREDNRSQPSEAPEPTDPVLRRTPLAKKLKRLGLLLGALLALSIAWMAMHRPKAPAGNESNPLRATLSAQNCELWQDPDGLSHLRGADELGAYACLGWVH